MEDVAASVITAVRVSQWLSNAWSCNGAADGCSVVIPMVMI
jgi:hypothetical protein